jgi:hypothetical protein
MHILMIIALMLAFPALAKFFGSIARMIFWLFVIAAVVATIGAIAG